MKRIYWKIISLITFIITISPIIVIIFFLNPMTESILSNDFVFVFICIAGLFTGFTMDSWWKKDNPILGY